ncbi:MarR family winged helix-turn-helix transcriptional regulator [Rhizobium puerariae]|uniref:MarR family winged helix-turn-helix transcriptional regulator n=1 Tax=Rhizobium puerariae TaxID=1585791 RepID=A0ABV6AMK5_9HYPH
MSGFDPESLKGVAAECPGFQARATARAVTRYYNACFKPLGLTAEQFSLLVGIGAAEGATVVDLAVGAGVDATTLSRNVQNLEARGLVQAEGGRGRAGKRLNLTHSGRRLMAEALPLWKTAKAELSRRMGDERLRSATRAMAQLARAAASTQDSARPENALSI